VISINANTRQFSIPGADLTFGVEADNGTARKHFQCPRYVGDNLDVASCFVRINYRNANGVEDSYLVEDLKIDGTNVTFSWLLHPKVTEYKGQVKFVVCLVGPDLKLKWHTTQGTGQVLEGLEPDNSHVEDETADVVAALIAMVTAQTAAVEAKGAEQVSVVNSAAEIARNNAVAEIEAKRVNSLASIPNDYTTLNATVEKLARSVAPGIVCDAEGEAITLSDASDNYFRGVRIFGKSTQAGTPSPDNPVEIVSVESPVVMVGGKNLLKPQYGVGTHTINTLTFVVHSDGRVVVNGTPTTNTGFVFERFDVVDDVILTGCPAGGTTRTYRMTADCYKNDQFVETAFDLGEGLVIKAADVDYVNINIFVYGGTALTNLVFYPMLRSASDPNPTYEPYKPIQNVVTTHPLRGIPVTSGGNYTDSNGQQWICDEIDFERGVYIQRINRGTAILDQVRDLPDNGMSYCAVHFADKQLTSSVNFMCDRARVVRYSSGSVRAGDIYENTGNFVFVDEPNATLEQMKAKFDGATIQYMLKTPIETPLTETELAAYRSLHTNKPNTTILNDGGAHMAVEYTADTKLYIDNKIKEVK
jgi:hypothetical protein